MRGITFRPRLEVLEDRSLPAPIVKLLSTSGLMTGGHDVARSADNRFAVVRAYASPDSITFYGLNSGARIGVFPAATGPIGVDSVEISPNSSRTVTVGGAELASVQIFNTSGAAPVLLASHPLMTAADDLAISPNNQFVVVRNQASPDGVAFYRLSD